MCSAGHALRTMFRLKKQALPHKASLGNPLELTMKGIFFLRKKRNASSGGLRLTPKLQQAPASGAQHVKSRCSTGTSKFHQTVETQQRTDCKWNLFITVWTQYYQHFIGIFQIHRFCNCNTGLTSKRPWAVGLSSSGWSKRHFDWLSSAKGTEDHGAMAAMAGKASLLFTLIHQVLYTKNYSGIELW